MNFCLVVNGDFDRKLSSRPRQWDAVTTLAPEDLTEAQRVKYGCYFFTKAEELPSQHTPGDTSYSISVDTVTEIIPAIPFTPAELEAEKEEELNKSLNINKFFKAFAKVAAQKWGMTGAQFKAAIKDQM